MTERRKIVLLHGYSSNSDSLRPWRDALVANGYTTEDLRLGDYISLSNEITIRDIAEGLDRALREQGGLDSEEEFDAIVHSTGSLVIREWLVSYEGRQRRLKNLICLAPANFGSPMAHRGRSVLGAVVKGRRNDPLGPDFLEPGDRVLSALELGSSYTWNLAHRDLLAPEVGGAAAPEGFKPIYSSEPDTPYPFVFIGLKEYRFQNLVIHEDGYDGTVRWAGAALNTRKLVIDLTRVPVSGEKRRVDEAPRSSIDIPLVLVEKLNHATILSKPDPLIGAVMDALKVDSWETYAAWTANHVSTDLPSDDTPARWQQFIVRLVDERGDPIPDYYIGMGSGEGEVFSPLEEFSVDVHEYRDDRSYRCFHVNLDEIEQQLTPPLKLRVLASSGTPYIGYFGVNSGAGSDTGDAILWNAKIDLALPQDFEFFYPFTTTLVEIRLNREPTPPADPDQPGQQMGLIGFSAE